MRNFLRITMKKLFLFILVLCASLQVLAVGWTPTDAGLVVNLDQGDRFLLSVWVDKNGNGTEEPGEEFFVSNYTRYTGGYYNYGAGTYMKLLPADTITEMNEWQVGYPLDRGNKALGAKEGTVYTIWNDGKTLKTSDSFKFLGDLTSNYADAKACDVVFVIPTDRGVPTVDGRNSLSSFDPNNTLKRGTAPFNSRMGTGFRGMTYREVYMFDIPKANSPQSYANAALVTFNTTLSTWKLGSGAGEIVKGKAAYAYADSKHDATPRTLFRLYLLDDPINSCSSYFFATDEQDYINYRKNEGNPIDKSDSTAFRKIYTMDRMFCMNSADEEHCVQTDYMYVPVLDSTYYYVGHNNDYKDKDKGETMGTNGAHSMFSQIRGLTILGLADSLKAPAGAFGRMVADTTSALDNLNVKFKPAGYFLKVSTGTNVQLRPNADSTIWTCEEMWHIDSTYLKMQIKATMFSGPEYSPTDEGIDIPGWSVFVTGNTVPLADHTQHVTGGMDGWAHIHADSSQANGYMEFTLANPRYHIHYDYNGLLGIQVPDQYPAEGQTTVTVEKSRLVNGFNFTKWTTNPDGSGTSYNPGDVVDLSTILTGPKDSTLTLYAQGSYNGTYHVVFSFEHSNGKRYFLTQPIGTTNRYARARPVGDWTDTYQGMSDPYNTEPNYISTYKLIGHPTCELCDHNETSYEYVLDPRREWRYGAKDSLLFYSNFAPANDEFLGLSYDDRKTPFKEPVTIVANNSWAGAFTSTSKATATGWPDYSVADVQNTKLKSEYYFSGFMEGEGEITRHERPNKDSSYVKYNEELNQFDGVRTEGEATTFQISRVRVADEHYVVLPDTTKAWRDTIEFAYHNGEQSREQVWTSMIGKHLLAVTKVGNDTVYFHPDPDIIKDPNNLYLDKNYRVSQVFEFIPDSRVSTAVSEEDRATHETTSYHWHNDIVSGLNSPIDVKDAEGNYIDIVDTFRITMSHGGISKIKQYYGRWKNGARGLKVNGDGSVRTRDVIVRTKTYHYGNTITHLVLKPEFKSYIFNPLAGNSQQINFTLAHVTAHQLVDVNGNPIGDEEVIDSDDITSSLSLGPGACSFSSGSPGSYFNVISASSAGQHVTLATKDVNKEIDNHDTLIISTTVTYGGKEYPVTARVPLVQTSLEGDELIWSVESGNKRYYIMAGTGGLKFRQYALKDGTLYKEGTSNTALIKGSKDAANDDKQYITPWRFIYNPENANQVALKTEYEVNRYFKMLGDAVGDEGGVHPSDSSLLTFHYVDVLTNDNANEEELVKLQYGADKWLKFRLTGGSGAELVLVDSKDSASVFSWSYLNQEYSLLNNGAYPDRDTVIFGYNTDMSVAIQAPYKAYKEYSMLVDSSVVYCCREQETDMANLTAGGGEWKTNQTFSLISDARDFDGDPNPESGISQTANIVSTSGDSPTDVMIGGKYVNIVDTLQVTLSLRDGAPAYRFKGDWSKFRSVSDAELKIPLIRKTYHVANYDSLVCVVNDDAYNHTFPNTITDPVSYTFKLSTMNRTGHHVLDVANTTMEVLDKKETLVTKSGRMDLSNTAMAEVLLLDEFGNKPTWCRISGKGDSTITVQCTQSGIRTPRMAYIRIFYIIVISDKMYVVTEQLTVSQPSYFQYANNQHLVHSPGASGDPLRADGMQQVHENKRILYYYPEQDVELPIRDYHFFGWWRWFREGAGEIGDSDIPEASWRKKPSNTGSGKSGSYNFPFRIIGDSVKVPNTATPDPDDSVKVLMTMGRYTVFHYKAADYNDNKKNPPVKVARVAPPITTYGEEDKPTVTYAAEISNYYDNLPMSLKYKNQVDTALMDTMPAIPEPTLSLREIFELRPWTEMAERLDHYKTRIPDGDGAHTTKVFPLANEKYMEDHVMMAPLGNELLLSTEQRYILAHLQTTKQSESLLGYYMRDDHWSDGGWTDARKDTMIWCGGWDATCQWYTYNPKTQKYTICNHETTVSDDFLKVPKKENITNGQEFDTVYYCLRARSQSTTGEPGVSETTVDGNYMFNICRYKLIYHKPGKYGPLAETKDKAGHTKALITNDDIEQHYEVLERLNFDYNKPGPEYTIYPHPLPWADASYGYTYPETPDLPHNRLHAHSDFPNHGEYGLINRIPTASHWGDGVTSYWRPMEQHGGASNGYMIYCDGMSSSGQVASLSLETHLCSGQKMFFSGYVCNPSNQSGKADPNFTFSVQGSVNGTDWDDITSYTTGGIKPSSQWSQIYFPIVFDENIDYQHFRVRIYNVSSDWDGNDFIIDDMCIFATKPPLIAYQANTACKEKTDEDLPSHVILRVDYQGIVGEGYNDTTVCYTLKSVNKDHVVKFVPMIDGYLDQDIKDNPDPSKSDTIYGRLFIPGKTYEPTDTDSIFVNMNQLIDTFEVSSEKHKENAEYKIFKEGYIYEILEGDIRPVKYVVHNAFVNAIDTFTVHMSGNYKDMLSSLCGMTHHLKVSNQMVLELNGEEQPTTESTDLCANSTYDIGLRVKGSLYLDSVAPINLNGTCANDWLLYGDTADLTGSPKRRYGYKYSDIVKVVKDILRCDPPGTENANQFAPNLAAVSRNEMQRIKDAQTVKLDTTAHPYDILADLVDKGFLTLYQSQMTASVLSGDSVQYVIFPILGTGTDTKQHSSVDVCPLPILIKLKPQSSSAIPLIVGGLNRDPSEKELPVVVLADRMTANTEFTLKVDSIMPRIGIASVKLRATDDPDFQEGFHKLALVPDLDYPQTKYYIKGNYITLQPASSNNYTMKQGYNYTFAIDLQTILGKDTLDGGCKVGTVPFTLAVVPDYLRWDPQDSIGSQWNKHGNWMGIDQYNQPMHATARFAPLSTTSIIIPAMTDGRPYPELPNLTDTATYDSVKQVGFQYNQCNTIRFMPDAAIGNQQYMNYSDVVVDMKLPQQTWALRGAPVKGMISGDLYMANADLNNETPLWEVGEFDADGRNYRTGNGSFWLSLYSKATVHKVQTGDDEIRSAGAEWSKVTNGMTLPLSPAQGFAVYARTASGSNAVVRLPKNDDIYYYYGTYGEKLYDRYEQNLQNLRNSALLADGEAGKLAFYPDGTSQDYTLTNGKEGTYFVFGNPTMGYIDIWGFIADNEAQGLEAEIGYINAAGTYIPTTKAAAALATTNQLSERQRYLPPMHAIVLKKSAAASSLKLTLNTSRIVTDTVHHDSPASAPRYRAGTPVPHKGIMTITAINPVSPRCNSRLLLGQGYHNAILSGEDAILTTLNIDNFHMTNTPTTPFNIYAIKDSCGLSINLLDSIVNVPISFYMSDLPYEPTTQLWFTGVNSIDGQLVLYDALLGTERTIIDGICLTIETPDQNHQKRYYIRRRGFNPDTTEPGDTPTGYEPIEREMEQVYKIIDHNHVYIIRGGHVYTVTGQKVR